GASEAGDMEQLHLLVIDIHNWPRFLGRSARRPQEIEVVLGQPLNTWRLLTAGLKGDVQRDRRPGPPRWLPLGDAACFRLPTKRNLIVTSALLPRLPAHIDVHFPIPPTPEPMALAL